MARPHIDIDFSPFTRAFGFAAGALSAVMRAIEDGERQRQHARDAVLYYDFETYAGTGTYMGRYYPMVCKWASESRKKNAHIARYRLNAVLPLDRARTRYGSAPWIFTGRYYYPIHLEHFDLSSGTPVKDEGCILGGSYPIYRCYDVNHRDFAAAYYIGRGYANGTSNTVICRGAP